MGQPGPDPIYREQLAGWARALAAARDDLLHPALDEGSSPGHVRIFTESNLAKRREKLRSQVAFVAEAFGDFEDLIIGYLRQGPMAAYGNAADDGERFLRWVERIPSLTPEQRDYVACQRARHAVEAEGRRNRLGHLRFQELWSTAGQLGGMLGSEPRLRIHLNPIRGWSRFATSALLGEGADVPADVIFFAVRSEVGTAVLEPVGRAMIEELADFGPCTLDQWADRSQHSDREGLVGLCRDLAEMGLVAFA